LKPFKIASSFVNLSKTLSKFVCVTPLALSAAAMTRWNMRI
jgi:hypothetical protein